MTTSYQPFYAGGSKGKEARADGRGGLLPRGFHFQDGGGEIVGPFKTAEGAAWAALLAAVMDAQDNLSGCVDGCYQGDNASLRQKLDTALAHSRLSIAQEQASTALNAIRLATGGQHGHG